VTATDDLLADRRRLLGPSLSVSYRTPLHIVRGEDDITGNPQGHARATSGAIDRGDRRLRHGILDIHRLHVELVKECPEILRVALGRHAQVHAAAEHPR